MKKPELLSPAGTLKNQRYAFAFGADAVYAGLPRYSLRVRNNDFKLDNLEIGINEAHAMNKQFFVAVNLMPQAAKLKTFVKDMTPVIAMKPDAFIMSDPGLIMLVREKWPEMDVHLSVQANTVNAAAVKFWEKQGLTRIILSRELSLDEIEEIRQQCPDIELEVFVHGALCIAYSGRCLLSGYFNHRDANQGSCTNTCRWKYDIKKGEPELTEPTEQVIDLNKFNNLSPNANFERHPEADKVYMLEEENRPGELMPVFEDEHGTYIMNSKDLRAVEHVQKLVEIGIDCLKIEGRTKSHYYAARTAQVYRQAIDDAVAGREFNPALMGELDSLANRGYTDGFYQRHHSEELQTYHKNASESPKQKFVGEVIGRDEKTGKAIVAVKNHFEVGDSLELLTPTGSHFFKLTEMEDQYGHKREVAPGSGYEMLIDLPVENSEKGLITQVLA